MSNKGNTCRFPICSEHHTSNCSMVCFYVVFSKKKKRRANILDRKCGQIFCKSSLCGLVSDKVDWLTQKMRDANFTAAEQSVL